MEETKRCSFCGEKILAVAIKCKHCNEWFDDRPTGQSPVSGSHSGSHPGSHPTTPSGHTPLTGIHLANHALGDRYEILEEIGRGGMATVYKAIQKSLERTVALKVVHQNLLHDTEFVARFHREAKLCASLNHPNIVTVHDEGEVSGVHFMAMEYLEGTDLHRLIRSRGRLTPQQTLQYLLPVAEALDYAHGKGYIHRDIKSANIFITGSGRVVLMDFGIAHAAAGTQLTRAGTVIGTPEYMSPEQAEGKKVDQRTDLYSLGVVMYECLAGRVPFKGDSAITTIYKLLHEQPDLQYLHQISNNLKTFIQRLLSKIPDQRPLTAEISVQHIRQLLFGDNMQPTHFSEGSLKKQPHLSEDRNLSDKDSETVKIEDSYEDMLWAPSENEKERHLHHGKSGHQQPISFPNKNDPFNDLMVWVEGGTFIMGATKEQGWDAFDDERPAHTVTLDGYYICKYPVTQRQWLAIMDSNPSFFEGRDDCPVENVNWEHVQNFIDKLNKKTGKRYSLPTEAQWEFAARGGQISRGFKYAGSNNIGDVAWYRENSNSKTHPVGRKRANELGIYDMNGNVWEWCSDWYGSYSSGSKTNPTGPSSGADRVLRGGSWNDDAGGCRVSSRISFTPDGLSIIGFRLVLSP